VYDTVEARFADAVESALEGGLLRYSKRLELLGIARSWGLERFQATLIMALVQYRHGHSSLLSPPKPMDDDETPSQRRSRRAEFLLKVAAMVIAAALMDLVLLEVFLK